MELLSSINNSGIGAQYAVSAAKDVNGNEITSTYLTAVPEGYATESFVTSQGYITGSYLTADALDSVSSTWNTVTDKLNTTAFSTVSGNFLTAHQSLPNSANWNSTYTTVNNKSAIWDSTYTVVNSNAANWNATYLTVHDNSASWTGSEVTLPVSGSAGDNSAVYDLYDMKIEYNLPSVGGSEPEHTYVQAETNSIKVYESYDGDQSYNQTYIGPNYIELYNDADGSVDFDGTDVLNWKDTRETVSNNSASWAEGTEYSAGSGIDITNDVISLTEPLTLVPSGDVTIDVTGTSAVITVTAGASYTGDAQGALDEVYSKSGDWNTVTNKLDSTAFSTVSGDFLTAHQTLSDSANWNATYTAVSNNSATWATVTDKLNSTAFSTVSGDFLTAHQSLPNSANWDSTYTTVYDNSASWTGGDGGVVTSTAGTDGYVTAINGSGLSGQAEISLPILNSAADGSIYYSAKYDTNQAELLQGNSTAWKLKAGITPYGVSASGNGGYATLSYNRMYYLYQAGSTARSYELDVSVPKITLIKGSDKGVVNISNINNWNSAFSAVSSNSGSWNDVVTTVSTNSASWTGGGGTSYTAGNCISLTGDIVAWETNAGITDIVSATALPQDPVSSVLYLIPEV